MREPRGNRENRMQVERKERGKARKVSWRELKSELEGSQAAERHRILTVVSLNGCGGEKNLESDSQS